MHFPDLAGLKRARPTRFCHKRSGLNTLEGFGGGSGSVRSGNIFTVLAGLVRIRRQPTADRILALERGVLNQEVGNDAMKERDVAWQEERRTSCASASGSVLCEPQKKSPVCRRADRGYELGIHLD